MAEGRIVLITTKTFTTMLDKNKLSCDHEIALTYLIELVRDIGLFELSEDGECLHTTGKTLNLETFDKNDWLLCLDAIGEKEIKF